MCRPRPQGPRLAEYVRTSRYDTPSRCMPGMYRTLHLQSKLVAVPALHFQSSFLKIARDVLVEVVEGLDDL